MGEISEERLYDLKNWFSHTTIRSHPLETQWILSQRLAQGSKPSKYLVRTDSANVYSRITERSCLLFAVLIMVDPKISVPVIIVLLS
jgi:hypothetical protein